MAGLVESLVRMPIRWASRATLPRFTFMPTCANTELSEWAVADQSDEDP